MQVVECAEKRPRFETQTFGNGNTYVRLYEDETVVEATEMHPGGYRYTTYTVILCLPARVPDLNCADNADQWADFVKQRDAENAAKWAREERDKRLLECDWAVLPDAQTDRAAWKTYRQALRDVPEQAGFPYAIEWPEIPEK